MLRTVKRLPKIDVSYEIEKESEKSEQQVGSANYVSRSWLVLNNPLTHCIYYCILYTNIFPTGIFYFDLTYQGHGTV